MTPAELARQIDRDEFEAESQRIRQRAHALTAASQARHEAKLKAWHDREVPVSSFNRYQANRKKVKPERTEPKRPTRIGAPHKIDGVTRTRSEWARHLGITLNAFNQRVYRLGTVKAAVEFVTSKPARDQGVASDFEAFEETGGWTLT